MKLTILLLITTILLVALFSGCHGNGFGNFKIISTQSHPLNLIAPSSPGFPFTLSTNNKLGWNQIFPKLSPNPIQPFLGEKQTKTSSGIQNERHTSHNLIHPIKKRFIRESRLETGGYNREKQSHSPTKLSPCHYKSDQINWRKQRHKQNENRQAKLHTFPRYAPVVGVRALSNLQVFFAHMYENLIAIQESESSQTGTAKRMTEHYTNGPTGHSEHAPTGIRCIVAEHLANNGRQEKAFQNYYQSTAPPPHHHPVNLLLRDAARPHHTPRIPPWDPAWKWDGISLGKRKQIQNRK